MTRQEQLEIDHDVFIAIKNRVGHRLRFPITMKDLEDQLNLTTGQVRGSIKRLEETGHILVEHTGRKGRPNVYSMLRTEPEYDLLPVIPSSAKQILVTINQFGGTFLGTRQQLADEAGISRTTFDYGLETLMRREWVERLSDGWRVSDRGRQVFASGDFRDHY